MTIGATVLEWSQPASSAQPPPGRQLIAQLRDAIRHVGQDDTAGQRWQAIRIEPQDQDSEDAAAACHLLLRRDGTLELIENPRAQRQLAEEGVIGIALEVSAGSNQATQAQRRTARQLIHSLQQTYGIPSRAVLPNDALDLPILDFPSPQVERPE